ncbi:spore coat protein [Herbinix luporum]|jgi:spore coat protein CotF|uniref:Spore coat protein n=1 Tax=Herbinix luporum TaxID=1679721 RepID=A0A0K8J2V0_9FIRM|nr:spore coat protein [Herbinix luporum]MDI9487854.1 spore coat protein [Bacillota bacterium]CUH91805.1 hypothetical protein SD1D_0252 [Herbinix luporum]HHT56867.1 spore coat protein [Herbinix luporum]
MITNVSLTTKEQYLLQDQKSHEQQCVLKYDNYANLASDAQLKSIFTTLGQKEKEHLQTINQLLNGQIPNITSQGGSSSQSQNQLQQQGQQQNQQQQSPMAMSGQPSMQQSASNTTNLTDKDMCTDMLSTEKYISGTYDTAIFEFKDPRIRDVLNHIQKEEQKHGETIFQYMLSKGMYTPQ